MELRLSKCGAWASCLGVTWELVELQPPLQTYSIGGEGPSDRCQRNDSLNLFFPFILKTKPTLVN